MCFRGVRSDHISTDRFLLTDGPGSFVKQLKHETPTFHDARIDRGRCRGVSSSHGFHQEWESPCVTDLTTGQIVVEIEL